VIKTWDEAGSKVFINVCHSSRIPLPPRWRTEGGPPATLNELETLDSAHVPEKEQGIDECLCIPMVFSPPRPDVDHSGNSCAGKSLSLSVENLGKASHLGVWDQVFSKVK